MGERKAQEKEGEEGRMRGREEKGWEKGRQRGE